MPAGRRFERGNPGRPKGTRNKATLAAEALLEGEAEALTRKAIELALAGDGAALRLCLERIVPVRRGRAVALDLPPVRTAADLTAAQAGAGRSIRSQGRCRSRRSGVDRVGRNREKVMLWNPFIAAVFGSGAQARAGLPARPPVLGAGGLPSPVANQAAGGVTQPADDAATKQRPPSDWPPYARCRRRFPKRRGRQVNARRALRDARRCDGRQGQASRPLARRPL